MESQETCAVCGRAVALGEGYVVRMDVMADPRLAEMSGEEIEGADLAFDFRCRFAPTQ